MKSRFISTLILVPIVIILLFTFPLFWFGIVNIFLCILAGWEWTKISGIIFYKERIVVVFVWNLMLCFSLFLFYQKKIDLIQYIIFLFVTIIWWLVAFILVIFYPNSAVLWNYSCFLKLIFGFFTLFPFFLSVMLLRQYKYESDTFFGSWCLLFILFLVWGVDSGSYFFGKLFGKHQLAARLSPQKTLEGLLGGFIFSNVFGWMFFLSPLAISIGHLFFFGILATLLSVLGDLTESMFKREVGIKDSGNLIPGHGGILDRIDSLTSVVPIFSCLIFIFFSI